MEVFLKKHFWVLNLVVILLAAGFLGRATEHLMEASFLPPIDKPAGGSRRPLPPRDQAPHNKDESAILDRNIFCSGCPPIRAKPEAETPQGPSGPVKTSMPVRLVVTAVSKDPRWSIIVLCDTQTKECGAFGLDSKVREATVISIDEKRAEFDVHGRVEFIELEGPQTQLASNTPIAPQPGLGDDDPMARDLDKGVKKVSETEYQVNRELLDKVLGDTNLLARSARIVPNIVDGKPSGFKLYAIRPNSVYARIGLQNGDAVQAINGYDMSSPDKALEVYTKLRRANHLTVSVTRRGQPTTLDYSIR
jgi:general secretion pathway protein C